MSDARRWPEDARPASESAVAPGTVAGVYRVSRPWAVGVWAAGAACWALAATLNFQQGHAGSGAVEAAACLCFLTLLVLDRLQRTVVARSGVRVRTDIRARTLAWDQIRAIHDPGRWAVTDTLTLATTTGEQVATHIPRDRRAALEAYAAAHGARATPEGGQSGTDGP